MVEIPCIDGEAPWDGLLEADVPLGDDIFVARLSRGLVPNPFAEGKLGMKFGAEARTGVADSKNSIGDVFSGSAMFAMDK